MYFLGVDIGSLTCDAVLIDEHAGVLASAVVPTGARNREAIARATQGVLGTVGIAEDQVTATIATGYGRERVERRLAAVTEITCHAKGIQTVLPGTRVLIDVGGQDSKTIRLDGNGRVLDFAMNDKCAAGTGRFLEAMARALQVDIDQLGDLEKGATGKLTISSVCTVFAESEVVSLIAEGIEVPEIAAALHRSIAARIVTLVRRVAPDLAGLSLAMSGGVAHNTGVVRAIEASLEHPISVPPSPDTIGALGAALIARDRTGRATP